MNLSSIGKKQQLMQQKRSNQVVSPKNIQIKQIYSKVPPRNGIFQLFDQQIVNRHELQLGESIEIYLDKNDCIQSMEELSNTTEDSTAQLSPIYKNKKQPLMPFPNYQTYEQQQQYQQSQNLGNDCKQADRNIPLCQILKQQDILIKQQHEATERLQRLQKMRIQKRFKPVLKKNISNKDYGCLSPNFVNYYEEKLLGKYKVGKHLKQLSSPESEVNEDDFNEASNDFD